MKSSLIALIPLAVGCSAPPPVEPSPEERAVITAEVDATVKRYLAAMERADAAEAFGYVVAPPGYQYVDSDGHLYDDADARRFIREALAKVAVQKGTPRKVAVQVLGRDTALCAWSGAVSVTPKSGPALTSDPLHVTLLLRRVDGAWRVAYQQESSQLPLPAPRAAPGALAP